MIHLQYSVRENSGREADAGPSICFHSKSNRRKYDIICSYFIYIFVCKGEQRAGDPRRMPVQFFQGVPCLLREHLAGGRGTPGWWETGPAAERGSGRETHPRRMPALTPEIASNTRNDAWRGSNRLFQIACFALELARFRRLVVTLRAPKKGDLVPL
jgi:hypothetical protein